MWMMIEVMIFGDLVQVVNLSTVIMEVSGDSCIVAEASDI